MWQHVKLSEQIRPRDTLACCWDVKQPTNKQTHTTPHHTGSMGLKRQISMGLCASLETHSEGHWPYPLSTKQILFILIFEKTNRSNILFIPHGVGDKKKFTTGTIMLRVNSYILNYALVILTILLSFFKKIFTIYLFFNHLNAVQLLSSLTYTDLNYVPGIFDGWFHGIFFYLFILLSAFIT